MAHTPCVKSSQKDDPQVIQKPTGENKGEKPGRSDISMKQALAERKDSNHLTVGGNVSRKQFV